MIYIYTNVESVYMYISYTYAHTYIYIHTCIYIHINIHSGGKCIHVPITYIHVPITYIHVPITYIQIHMNIQIQIDTAGKERQLTALKSTPTSPHPLNPAS